MTCWALVPIKARSECKGRLRADLEPPARRALARTMLEQVLDAAVRSQVVDQIVVVSPERDSVPRHISVIQDRGTDLNAALRLGRDHALAQGATELLVLAADLPQVTPGEIDALVALGRPRGVAIASDRSGAGTNALYVGRVAGFEFCFGSNSRQEHEHRARDLGISPARCVLPGLAADIDTASDLTQWYAACRPTTPVTGATWTT